MRRIVFDIETSNEFQEVGINDPAALEIAVVAVYDSEPDAYSTYFKQDLNKLWPIIESADVLVGFNSEHFDIPLLNKYYPGDLTKIKSIDLMQEVKKTLGKRIGLESIGQGTLKRGKTSHGLQALEWWRNGEYEKVASYCIEDVRLTKDVYEYALQNGKLRYLDNKEIKEVKVDTSNWEVKQSSGLTFTLPF